MNDRKVLGTIESIRSAIIARLFACYRQLGFDIASFLREGGLLLCEKRGLPLKIRGREEFIRHVHKALH